MHSKTSHLRLEYTYDTAGNVTSVKDLTEGTLTTSTYDLNGEVTSQVESLLSQGVPITKPINHHLFL